MKQEQEKLGDRVRSLRLGLRLTARQLGGRCDLSEKSVAKIEASVTQPQAEDVVRLAEALGVTEKFLRHGSSHAEIETNRWIDDNETRFQLTPELKARLKESASHLIKQRQNARNPLSPTDIEALLIILRGE